MLGLRLLTALVATLVAGSAFAQERPVVTTDSGAVRGLVEGSVQVFRGIPYAAPPVGDLRWRPPAPAVQWDGVHDAAQYGAACPQPPGRTEPWARVGPTSEDCLFLNVWRPDTDATDLPVMVFIHGGSFTFGSAGVPLYEGAALAERGVVLVSMNYRMGRLGFFAHPALTAEDPDGLLGNYGFMDQIAALRWVQANIAAFGGDPDNVTLFGESAGAGSVQIFMSSPEAEGLFDKAISQSGAGGSVLVPIRGALNSAETAGVAWAAEVGLTDASAADLRALPADVVAAGRSFPFIDGRVVPWSPGQGFRREAEMAIPMIVGANDNEATLQGNSDALAMLVLGAAYPDLLARYQAEFDLSAEDAARELREDALSVQASHFIGEMHADQAPTWAYSFTHVRSDEREGSAGAGHGGELEFLFSTQPEGQQWDDADREAARLIGDAWVRFATTGDPNGGDLPAWSPISQGELPYLILDATPEPVVTTPLQDEVRARALAASSAMWGNP